MSISGNSQIHINLEQKLAALFDDTSITEILGHKSSAENVRMLKDAMDRKKRVILMNYESNHSTSVSDRLVEPYGFSVNYSDVYAYEVSTGICKIFKICRVGWVRVTKDDWQNECNHEDITQDCFRMTGKECIPVCLKMTLKAKNLLIEEYPLSQRDLSYEDGFWYLRTSVKDLAGVGRFVIGLADQIDVIESLQLLEYVKNFVANYLNNNESNRSS
jgi:predicted DNA-binding transcriptional regulator YafY